MCQCRSHGPLLSYPGKCWLGDLQMFFTHASLDIFDLDYLVRINRAWLKGILKSQTYKQSHAKQSLWNTKKTWRVNKLLLLSWLSKESIRLKHHRSPVLFSLEVTFHCFSFCYHAGKPLMEIFPILSNSWKPWLLLNRSSCTFQLSLLLSVKGDLKSDDS